MIQKFIRYEVDGDKLKYYYIDEKKEVKVDSIPLMENGKRNSRVDLIIADVQNTINEVNKAKALRAAAEAQKKSNGSTTAIIENDSFESKKSVESKPIVINVEDDLENEENITDENVSDEDLTGYYNDELADEQEKQKASYKDVDDPKKKKWNKRIKKGVILAILGLSAAFALKACLSNKNKPVKTEQVSDNDADNINNEGLKEDNSRYTEISEEDLVNTTQSLMNEFANHGIELASDDALIIVAVANLTHIKATNPELLTVIFDGTDSVTLLTKVGHIVGQIVANEVTTKDNTVNWSIVFLDETDKKIADHNMNLISEAKQIIDNDKYPSEEKIDKVQDLFETKYVAPNFDKTVGYDFADGSHTSLTQEDGADFITNTIFTGIVLGDDDFKQAVDSKNSYVSVTKYDENKDYSNIKDHVDLGNDNNTWMITTNANELSNDLKAISENKDVLSNLMRIIDGCQDTNINTIEHNITK